MGCPACMTDANRARHRLPVEQGCQIAQFAFAAANRNLAVVENRNAGRIVTPVLELSKAFQNQWRRVATADISDNTAHYFLVPFIFMRFCSVQPSRSRSCLSLKTRAPSGTS